MKKEKKPHYVIGIDYGTDSCRAVIIDAANGYEISSASAAYPRWSQGLYCDPKINQFRQHPLDYIESLEVVMQKIHEKTGQDVLPFVEGIAIDTTGSTPCLISDTLCPLAMLPEFQDNPDAMFILWKDHTSTEEAFEITELARKWSVDYTMYEGGVYSSEWFWAKLLHIARTNPNIIKAGFSAIEHCDWMPALLTGTNNLEKIKRSRCAMGHKAMWHESFEGYPGDDFFEALDKQLVRIKKTLGRDTYTSDTEFGKLSSEWARRLHLRPGIPVGVGAYDAHMGAVGGGVEEGVLVKVMGTSTCDMIVGSKTSSANQESNEHLVKGICGQVDGSIIPGMIGYEAGQSAFGDVYAWFKNLLSWPLKEFKAESAESADKLGISTSKLDDLIESIDSRLMLAMDKAASKIEPEASSVLALDWLNGRRTPYANQKLKGAIVGLSLGSTAPMIYRALIESTAYGSRAIVERFEQENIKIKKVRAVGGVARKSKLVVQIVADVLGRPIEIVASDQSVALGAAMFASVVAGIYDSVPEAQLAMKPEIETLIQPDLRRTALYDTLYKNYLKLGAFLENEFE
jgi:L-ribulokinase